jgi:4-diphosphocytidyl-2-C-methyl-D-erythritol kinase
MLSFPNAKINIGLHVMCKRTDGYHELATIFYPLPVKDGLEIIQSDKLSCTITGLKVGGKEEDNLCVKAWQLLKKDFPQLPAVEIHLHKVIPMGAGLGGGSADGAFMLRLLNDRFELQLTNAQLLVYALELGSDCPFFIFNQPCFATGRGEMMTPIPLDLSAYSFVLVNPGIHVPTRWAFSQIVPRSNWGIELSDKLEVLIQQPIEQWRETIINDFELPVCSQFPAIGAIKEQLYQAGAIYASMTGSGSSVYGIFQKEKRETIHFPPDYLVLWV